MHRAEFTRYCTVQRKSPLIAMHTGVTYSMPGGAGSQLGLLEQHHIPNARLGQVVGQADPNTSPSDDHGVCCVLPPAPQDAGPIVSGVGYQESKWVIENS